MIKLKGPMPANEVRAKEMYTNTYHAHTCAKREGADGFTAPTNLVAALPVRR